MLSNELINLIKSGVKIMKHNSPSIGVDDAIKGFQLVFGPELSTDQMAEAEMYIRDEFSKSLDDAESVNASEGFDKALN